MTIYPNAQSIGVVFVADYRRVIEQFHRNYPNTILYVYKEYPKGIEEMEDEMIVLV